MAGTYADLVIKRGDEGSRLLAKFAAETYGNNRYVVAPEKGMHASVFLRIPAGYHAIVHSATGDANIADPKKYASSVVDRLVRQAGLLGAVPLGFSDVIDSGDGDLHLLREIGRGLVKSSNEHRLVILNGENAVMGERVQGVNMSALMVSMIRSAEPCLAPRVHLVHAVESFSYVEFDPRGKLVFVNADGDGTKVEFYERMRRFEGALEDSLAMKLDDAAKIGAYARVCMDVVETKGNIPFSRLVSRARELGEELNICYVVQREEVFGRISGYRQDAPAFHVGGSLVSVIDEARAKNPPCPHAGETLIAIHGKPNARSNGMTDKRRILREQYGVDWHQSSVGKEYLEYVGEPSIIFYPLFIKLLDMGLASSVYHMSGGALEGKLARPLAKQGLFCHLSGIFPPDKRELSLMELDHGRLEDWFAKCPMGNDAYVASSRPKEAMVAIKGAGYEAKEAGILEKNSDGKLGVELDLEGRVLLFSGK